MGEGTIKWNISGHDLAKSCWHQLNSLKNLLLKSSLIVYRSESETIMCDSFASWEGRIPSVMKLTRKFPRLWRSFCKANPCEANPPPVAFTFFWPQIKKFTPAAGKN